MAAPRWEQYDAEVGKSIIDLQPFRVEEEVVEASTGVSIGLTSLNPRVNAWFLLAVGGIVYHVENPDPANRHLHLEQGPPAALVIDSGGNKENCTPWRGEPGALAAARAAGLPYAPLCDHLLYLRNSVTGSRTTLEKVSELLRDYVWHGEVLVGFVRDTFYKDRFVESGETVTASAKEADGGPAQAGIDPADADTALVPEHLGLNLEIPAPGRMTLGRWYAVAGLPGIYASAIQPRAIDQQHLAGPGRTTRLDAVESAAVDYLVAFDLSRFELRFALGTEHPRLDWSPRPPAAMRDDALPGPDGVPNAEPLARTGMVRPDLVPRTVAAFAAGFKREHGAFKWGELSTRNHGSHYGFMEEGVIFSKLQPGLSTLLVLDDGTVDMKTWTEQDDQLLPRIRYARQNGVPLVAPGPDGAPVPGDLVMRWGPGNWSGSADARLRTLRGGACLQDSSRGHFLLYGYFSTATPSAMARTFQAYGCRYAMMLDMNALEHTYLALYTHHNGEVQFSHLIPGMSEVDRTGRDDKPIPRFLGYPDNRDFFYLTVRASKQ